MRQQKCTDILNKAIFKQRIKLLKTASDSGFMPKHIVFIHGIGGKSLDVAKSFEKNISAEIVHNDVKFHSFLWKQLVSKKEDRLNKILGKFPKLGYLAFNINLKEFIETYLVVRLRRFLINYLGDAVYYLSENSKKVKSQLEKTLFDIAKSDKVAEIILVSHSLGSVIAFDTLTDRNFQKRMRKNKLAITHFFTVGSPLALFLLRADTQINVTVPIEEKWINLYDRRDIIASKLHPFFKQCQDFEVKVENANAVTAHLKYFNDTDVLNQILRTTL